MFLNITLTHFSSHTHTHTHTYKHTHTHIYIHTHTHTHTHTRTHTQYLNLGCSAITSSGVCKLSASVPFTLYAGSVNSPQPISGKPVMVM